MTTVQAVIALQIRDASGVLLSIEAATEALECARVVAVLDEWAVKDRGDKCDEQWTCRRATSVLFACCLSGNGGSIFYGPTPDAARAAAARAIEAGEV